MKKKLFLISLIIFLLALFFYFDLGEFLTLENLKEKRKMFLEYYQNNPFFTIFLFVIIYISAIALSLPWAGILNLSSGAIFGTFLGTMIADISATLGAVLAFLSSRYLFRNFIELKFGRKTEIIKKGFKKGGINYLLFLRIVPVFPFSLINLATSLTPINIGTYFLVTLIGIIPGTFIFASAGNNLVRINSLGDIFSLPLLLSCILLGLFPFLPLIYKKAKN